MAIGWSAGLANIFKHKVHEGHSVKTFLLKIFTPENVWALILFLIVVALVVFTTNDSPIWIYQGF